MSCNLYGGGWVEAFAKKFSTSRNNVLHPPKNLKKVLERQRPLFAGRKKDRLIDFGQHLQYDYQECKKANKKTEFIFYVR